MLRRTAAVCFVMLPLVALAQTPVHAQDVPGIEICTVEKTMQRRTSCLQSNVDFLQKTITKLTLDHQQTSSCQCPRQPHPVASASLQPDHHPPPGQLERFRFGRGAADRSK